MSVTVLECSWRDLLWMVKCAVLLGSVHLCGVEELKWLQIE